jgi:type IV pilus assembly protein PilM
VNMNLKREIKLSELVRRSGNVKKAGASKALRGEVVGLKIGASQLAASRVANNGSARLLQLARGPLPSGIVVSGEVRDIPALAAALSEFFRAHKLPRRDVRLGVATNRIGVRSFELAGIEDEHQLENAIRFRAHEALSIPVDDAVLDYHVVSETFDDSGRTVRRVVLAAAYRDSIDRYVAACKQAGIDVVAVDLEAFALLRTVAPALAGEARSAVVAVTIGHDRTTLAISDGAVCDFTRVLEWGGSSLATAIERELGIDASEAAELKRALSLETASTLGADADERKSARAREAVRRELQSLARDLVNSLQFYQTQPGSLAISEILLAGGTSRLNGLPEELERLTQVRVRRADPLARVQVADSVGSRDDLPSLAVAIGLGIEV